MTWEKDKKAGEMLTFVPALEVCEHVGSHSPHLPHLCRKVCSSLSCARRHRVSTYASISAGGPHPFLMGEVPSSSSWPRVGDWVAFLHTQALSCSLPGEVSGCQRDHWPFYLADLTVPLSPGGARSGHAGVPCLGWEGPAVV